MNDKTGVYKAIVAVQGALAKEGISKDRTNTQGATYKFRGIDDVYNALAPFLAEHKLCILPRILCREQVERVSKQGGALFYTIVEAEFDFVSAEDGSMHVIRTFGEAMDSGDKGTNKAMSAAYKYAAFQAFCIPTEGDNDADASTHEVKPQKPTKQPPPPDTDIPGLSEAQKTLMIELGGYCSGNQEKMSAILKECSYYKKADGKEGWLKLEDLRKKIDIAGVQKWIGSTLGKFREKINGPGICADCRTEPCQCREPGQEG